jgi:hypothetical protein
MCEVSKTEKRRPPPGALVERSSVERIAIPSFRTVTNREDVIFEGAAPEVQEAIQSVLVRQGLLTGTGNDREGG